MDSEQPHLRRRVALAAVGAALLAALLACGRSTVDVAPVGTAVASTLTMVATLASPTPTSTPAPTATPAPTDVPTVAPPTAVPPTSASPPTAAATAAPTEAEGNIPGVIAGGLSYPSEGIPRLAIVFFNQDDGTWWWIGTAQNQGSYQMTVPVGTYHVVAYTSGGLAGGYTAAVPCGLSAACTDHTLLDVHVGSNAHLTGIDVSDWYAGAGTFPPKPAGVNYP
jgi:hypothetical protein